ncbi:unnamed protein product [Rhizoctonia solani]|uniref:Putative 5'-nucleotidase C-terminal domain-containing protein n=1 Tax=Rhizoctonia solani TaxID=456999 RepID=A0A8H3CM19_9AGAM|nr:unnamed protein product [Rhizoctonia solani]
MRTILLGILSVTGLAMAKPVNLVQSESDPHNDPSQGIPPPTRPLDWGDVNVLHTTDIHGWLSGHKRENYPEMSWSGTFGDFYSFVTHMRKKAEDTGEDLLLVDTGDHRFGNGLTDRTVGSSDDAKCISCLYHQVGYDLLVPGNYDLQDPKIVELALGQEHELWGDKYLTSNVDRTDENDPKKGEALGARYRYWKTPNKRQMLAFGVVTSKTQTPYGIKVVPIHEMIQQKWVNLIYSLFKEAIDPDLRPVDAFVLLGHVSPGPEKLSKEDDIGLIYKALRKEHPLTPILIFTGHTHKRWCKTFRGEDGITGTERSMLIQSGRHFDTVSWMSVEVKEDPSRPGNLKFNRRYLDNNVPTYMHHTGKDESNFHLDAGKRLTKFIEDMGSQRGLSEVYGKLDSDYFLDRKYWIAGEENKESLFEFYLNAVETSLIPGGKSQDRNWLFFSDWKIFRGDIYKGPFTVNDLYTVSSDATGNAHFFHTTVTRKIADQIVHMTRRVDKAKGDLERLSEPRAETLDAIDGSQTHFSLASQKDPLPPQKPVGKTYGWVTEDKCGNGKDGDDVLHFPLTRVNLQKEKDGKEDLTNGLPVYFWRDNYTNKDLEENDPVDIIVTNRIGNTWVPKALEKLGVSTKLYAYREDVNQRNLLPTYIKATYPSKPTPLGEGGE